MEQSVAKGFAYETDRNFIYTYIIHIYLYRIFIVLLLLRWPRRITSPWLPCKWRPTMRLARSTAPPVSRHRWVRGRSWREGQGGGTLKTLSGFTDFHHACIVCQRWMAQLIARFGDANCQITISICRQSESLSGNYLRYLKQVVASYLQAMYRIENKMPGSLLSWPAHPLWLAHSAYAQWAMPASFVAAAAANVIIFTK